MKEKWRIYYKSNFFTVDERLSEIVLGNSVINTYVPRNESKISMDKLPIIFTNFQN